MLMSELFKYDCFQWPKTLYFTKLVMKLNISISFIVSRHSLKLNNLLDLLCESKIVFEMMKLPRYITPPDNIIDVKCGCSSV